MSANAKQDPFRLGFLTAIEVPERGYVGGLLVTNRFGRPLEFQCTTPVKPNRTQEILYGPTLGPFVLGELLGKTLVEKASVKPDVILIEQDEILELRNHVSVPVACLSDEQDDAPRNTASTAAALSAADVEQATHSPAASDHSPANADLPAETKPAEATQEAGGGKCPLGRQFLRFHTAHTADRDVLNRKSELVPADADLREPFERVREALTETTRPGAMR